MKRQALTWLMLLCLTGCDCYQVARGYVEDAATGARLANVTVSVKGKDWDHTLTDSLGAFELSNISGGLFGCPDLYIVVAKENFETLEMRADGKPQQIKLKKGE